METKTCFKFPHVLEDNLNVLHNNTSRMIVFWNKYQIFLTDELQLINSRTRLSKWLLMGNTNFIINQMLLPKNHLLSLDNQGTLNVVSLNQPQKKLTTADFVVLDNNIMCMDSNEIFLFSIKYETNKLFLKIAKLNSETKLHIQHEIRNINLLHSPAKINKDKCILRCYMIDESDSANLNQNLLLSKKKRKHIIIIMSFDKLSLYIASANLDESETITPIKLTCPSEINNVTIIKENCLNLIISLYAGTVIKRPLTNNFDTPTIAHLHTAIHKFLAFQDKIIYTDGVTMWISKNTFRQADVELKQLFVKNIKDFIKLEEKIICTTYSKLIYIFNLADESCFVTPVTTSAFCSSEHVLSDATKYLYQIMEEVEKNTEIAKNIKEEENYITTLALSNRQDILSELIQYQIKVYEDYEDILKAGLILNFTNSIEEYFNTDSFYTLLQIITNTSLLQNFHDILSNIITNLNIHITVLSQNKIIKTVTFEIHEILNTVNIVLPLNLKKINITDISINIKIVKKIPKVLDYKHSLCTVLHCKQIVLTPEHFIKTIYNKSNFYNTSNFLKKPDTIENLIHEISCKHHGHLFKINKEVDDLFIWSFYIKLPNRYKEMLKDGKFYNEYFQSSKATDMLRIISSEQFLESKGNISLHISNERLDMEILSSLLTNKMLKISCANPVVAFGIRNFFSNLVHSTYGCQSDQEFYSCSVLDIEEEIQNIDTEVRKCRDNDLPFEMFLKIHERYEINVIATLV